MRHRRYSVLRYSLGLLAGVCALAASPQLKIPTVSAQVVSTPTKVTARPQAPATARTVAPKATEKLAKPYFIEFRARSALSYGHAFSMFGKLNAKGEIVTRGVEVMGLHPFTESSVPWMIGHLVPVPSEMGPSDGDYEDQYVTSRFHVALSADEYKVVVAYIRQLAANPTAWHAVFNNCMSYVGKVASFMGYKTPSSATSMPQEYIDALRDMNINRKDLTGVRGTPVKVADAETLRTVALRAIEQRKKPAAPKPVKLESAKLEPARLAR